MKVYLDGNAVALLYWHLVTLVVLVVAVPMLVALLLVMLLAFLLVRCFVNGFVISFTLQGIKHLIRISKCIQWVHANLVNISACRLSFRASL